MTEDEAELTRTESAVLDVAATEGRFNVALVREETGLDEPAVNEALSTLTAIGSVRTVAEGLYEYVPDEDHERDVRGIPDMPNEQTQTAPIDPDSVDSGTETE